MTGLNYSRGTVLWICLEQLQKLNPTAEEILQVDRDLHDTFEAILQEILPEFDIETRKDNKSRIILLSKVSAGGSTRTRVRNACRFYVNTQAL